MKKQASKKTNWFETFASKATKATGSNYAFITATLVVIIWLITGPLFHYSDTWQLVINTGTTIVTFLMVFLIQKTQNKDSIAMQVKLNELIAANTGASNRLVDVEDLTEKELEHLEAYYSNLAELAKKEKNLKKTHSIEDIEQEKKNIKKKIEVVSKKEI